MIMRRLMEGEEYQLMGYARIQFDGILCKCFKRVPDNLSRNVCLIRKLDNNIRRVGHLFSDLSSNLSKDFACDSRLDAKALQKRIMPA
ncbi:protein ELF4-LIKE 3 [Tanacetum coccineum]